jgi:hypothetical protein
MFLFPSYSFKFKYKKYFPLFLYILIFHIYPIYLEIRIVIASYLLIMLLFNNEIDK